MSILENIQSHQDLIKLNSKQRTQLCKEIREFLVSNVSKTGGHVSSNMGVVELTVALETVFDTSVDRLPVGILVSMNIYLYSRNG